MKKLLLLFVLFQLINNTIYSQSIEITKFSMSTSNSGMMDYDQNPIELYPSDFPYSVFDVTFYWEDFDPDINQIYFSIWKDDGTAKTKLNFSNFPAIESGSTSINASIGGINDDGTSFTIQASYYDDNNQEVFLVESDPWTVTEIAAPPTQIVGNKICCNQYTLQYAFDPGIINQDNSVAVSTLDGSNIASIQWQELSGSSVWEDIQGATQMSYNPPYIYADTKYRRVLTSSSGSISNSNPIEVKKVLETITGNYICCSQTTAVIPFDPSIITQSNNTTVASAFSSTFTYQWQQTNALGNFVNILGATNNSYNPPLIKNPALFRRIAISSNGTNNISNPIGILLQPCTRPQNEQNLICGDQTFYKVQHGDTINPGLILGDYDTPDIIRREFGYDFMISTDKNNWSIGKPKKLLSISDNSPYGICLTTYTYVPPYESIPNLHPIWETFIQLKSTNPNGEPSIINQIYRYDKNDGDGCVIVRKLLEFQPQSFIFDITKGNIQHLYIKKDYYEWYDPFNCGFLNTFPCGAQWYLKKSSNIATITLTTGDFPKPVAPINSSKNNVTCNWEDQTINFSVPQLNNQEYYKWTIPSNWTSYTSLEGYYVNQISVSSNSGDGNHAKGGQVCLEVTQGSQVDRQCITFASSSPTTIDLPATIRGCEGETVVIKPTLIQNNTVKNPADYNFSWSAYQSQNVICGNPALNNCKELTVNVSNVQQNPNQPISLTVRDNLGCKATASTTLTTSPGWQMGILNSYSDPVAKSTSTLSLDEANNFLYFVRNNGSIYRSYFDNLLQQWQYVELKDKTFNVAIKSDGTVAAYKGATNKLFYVYNNTLYYAESTDNGQTWVDTKSIVTVAQNVDSRIKVDGNNIYYINTVGNSRQVFYKSIININAPATLVGTIGMNYSQNMFTVEDGILAYADQSGNIVAFNTATGSSYPINISSGIKQVMYNSSISIYGGNIYYANSQGALVILKRNTSTGIYDNSEQVPGLQLAGPFAINKQTGTVYAKAYDVAGKQIYYLNGLWKTATIQNYTSATPIQSGMVYGNGHAFYIGTTGLLSNTFYIAPCVPAVLRTSGDNYDQTGDVLNDALSNKINEERTMLIYPNPTNSQIKATFTIPEESTVRINIIPITGGASDVLSNKIMESGTQELLLDLSIYSSGVYLIQLYVNESLYTTSKVVKF